MTKEIPEKFKLKFKVGWISETEYKGKKTEFKPFPLPQTVCPYCGKTLTVFSAKKLPCPFCKQES